MRQMLSEIDAREFSQWVKYAEEEPFGEDRQDQRTAAQTMWLLTPYGGGSESLPSLFYPYFTDQTEELEKQVAKLKEVEKKWLSQSQSSQST